ncbi:branched-chain amino acid ABC transporter permease [Enterovirga sp.]|uniref:branched-chain amino acid ABC transporter permease n=1 Tax=Enterovirga sp. TaxID=2026350 RepID=UPI00260B4F3D|nr:branched-chain amino acid ABC transporter permease [Enterovirga sp.]MDB5592888.1 branched-chain amino acid transporter permease [Enterovirga sp.]
MATDGTVRPSLAGAEVVSASLARHRFRPLEGLVWLAMLAGYWLWPEYRPLGSQIFIMCLFVLSLDIVVGYAGIVTLGHAAFFGVGAYTAGLTAIHLSNEPFLGLLTAAVAAGLVGILSGLIVLRTTGLTLMMLTLAIVFVLHEAANKLGSVTGGSDGLQGVTVAPILGLWSLDFFGQTAYIYTGAVLFLGWLFARILVGSPFGRSIVGIRENLVRMRAIGSPVRLRLLVVYGISATMAGIAGALLTQTTQFVSLSAITFTRSGEALIMLILGGVGRLYGAFVGAPIYMLMQDALAKYNPVFWTFWIGLMLVLTVMFARNGVLGLVDSVLAWRRRAA